MKTDVKKEKIPWLLSTKHNRQMFLRRKTDIMMVYGFLILLLVAAAFSSEVFMKPRNLYNLFSANTGLLLVTFAQLFVISLGGVVESASIKVAGDQFNEAVVKYMRRKHNILVG